MESASNKRAPPWRRWMPLVRTSPSGKTLFVCLVCGEVTPAPNQRCRPAEAMQLDPRLLQSYPDAWECSDIEQFINGVIDRGIPDELRLDWAENQLEVFEARHCGFCHGYGCQVCVGRGRHR